MSYHYRENNADDSSSRGNANKADTSIDSSPLWNRLKPETRQAIIEGRLLLPPSAPGQILATTTESQNLLNSSYQTLPESSPISRFQIESPYQSHVANIIPASSDSGVTGEGNTVPIVSKIAEEELGEYSKKVNLGLSGLIGNEKQRNIFYFRIKRLFWQWEFWLVLLLSLMAVFVITDLYVRCAVISQRLAQHEKILRKVVISNSNGDSGIGSPDKGGGDLDIFNSPNAISLSPPTTTTNQRKKNTIPSGDSVPELPIEDPEDLKSLRPSSSGNKKGGSYSFSERNNSSNSNGALSAPNSPLIVSVYSFNLPKKYKPLEPIRIPTPDSQSAITTIEGLDIDKVVSYDVCCRVDSLTNLCARGLNVHKSTPSISAHLQFDPDSEDNYLLLYLSTGGNLFSGKFCTLMYTSWRI